MKGQILPLEKEIERYFCQQARRKGCLCVKFNDPSHRGAPDRIILRDGGCIFVEFKRSPKEPLKPHQNEYIKKLEAMRFRVFVIGSKEEAKALLQVIPSSVN